MAFRSFSLVVLSVICLMSVPEAAADCCFGKDKSEWPHCGPDSWWDIIRNRKFCADCQQSDWFMFCACTGSCNMVGCNCDGGCKTYPVDSCKLQLQDSLNSNNTEKYVFDQWDTDKDGFLTFAEIRTQLDHFTEENFDSMDTNKLGKIDLEQFSS